MGLLYIDLVEYMNYQIMGILLMKVILISYFFFLSNIIALLCLCSGSIVIWKEVLW